MDVVRSTGNISSIGNIRIQSSTEERIAPEMSMEHYD